MQVTKIESNRKKTVGGRRSIDKTVKIACKTSNSIPKDTGEFARLEFESRIVSVNSSKNLSEKSRDEIKEFIDTNKIESASSVVNLFFCISTIFEVDIYIQVCEYDDGTFLVYIVIDES